MGGAPHAQSALTRLWGRECVARVGCWLAVKGMRCVATNPLALRPCGRAEQAHASEAAEPVESLPEEDAAGVRRGARRQARRGEE